MHLCEFFRPMRLGAILLLSCTLSVLSACKGVTVTPVAQLKSAADRDDQLAAIELDRVVFNFDRGQQIGAYRGGGSYTGCRGDGFQPKPIHWRAGKVALEDAEVDDALGQELLRAGYNVVGTSDQLFESASRDSATAEYLLGGRVDAVVLDVCDELSMMNGSSLGTQSGEVSVDVTWQVFSLMEQRVVLETRSRGSAKLEEGVPDGEVELLLRGLAAATANLAADQKFHALLLQDVGPGQLTGSEVGGLPILLHKEPIPGGSISQNIGHIQAAVVTLRAGASLGSGFFVAPDLIITNQHVVGTAPRIKVALIDGGEVYATTLRYDVKRDVALLQVESGSYPALPLRISKPNLAEEVYAIGSPIHESLAGTITKGIVSQLKQDENGLPLIQADVTVQPGSSGGPLLDAQGQVVGLAQSGFTDGTDHSIGINFFIPIGDALKHLNIVAP
jgi:serine protease Do